MKRSRTSTRPAPSSGSSTRSTSSARAAAYSRASVHGARGGRRADQQPAGGEALAEKRRLRALAAAVAALKRDQHAAPFAHAGLPRGLPGKGSRAKKNA